MVYCQNDQHWPWFIATVINRTLSEFFSKNKTDLRTLITCVRSLDLFYLITEREKNQLYFIRFSSFTFVYIFTSTTKRSQLLFVRLRSFTFPPSPLLPFQSLPSPSLHSRPSSPPLKQIFKTRINNFTEWSFAFCFNLSSSDVTSECIFFSNIQKGKRSASKYFFFSAILSGMEKKGISCGIWSEQNYCVFLKRANLFQSRIMFYMHLFVYKIFTIVTDVEFQVTFAIGPLNKRKCFKLFSCGNNVTIF